ncbi:MAG: hypothetical protein OXF31_08390 [Gammaproteobacteria bacterium]|nr:hypothetical protein [Gammaproteobacteria bacterium]
MQMLSLQAKDQDDEDITEAKRAKSSHWMFAVIGGFASALVPIVMSLSFIRQFQETVTLEMLLLISVLVVLVVLLFAFSIRQRYNERLYLRDWKERQDRQLALKHERQMESLERGDRQSRRHEADQMEWGSDDEHFPSTETRLLRSLGLEPPS